MRYLPSRRDSTGRTPMSREERAKGMDEFFGPRWFRTVTKRSVDLNNRGSCRATGPGARQDFTPTTSNINGSAASDQVYGFSGFDASNDEQRQVEMRRQVINALVGYGNVAPPGFVFGAGGRGLYPRHLSRGTVRRQ